MSRRITINVGFITNSSSCVYYFPKEVLEDAEVQRFMEAYGMGEGYVGSNLWSRQTCSSVLITKEQKEKAKVELSRYDDDDDVVLSGVSQTIDVDSDGAYILFGDEYEDSTQILCFLMRKVLARIKNLDTEYGAGYITDYN